jgi:hypothetical protein
MSMAFDFPSGRRALQLVEHRDRVVLERYKTLSFVVDEHSFEEVSPSPLD